MSFIKFLFSLKFVKHITSIICLTIILIIISVTSLSYITKHGESVEVPNLIGKTLDLVDIDLKTIKVEEEIDFSINVKELVRILNWSRFELLIFYTSVKDVEGLLTEYNKLGCLQGILDIKEHYSYFIDIIIK